MLSSHNHHNTQTNKHTSCALLLYTWVTYTARHISLQPLFDCVRIYVVSMYMCARETAVCVRDRFSPQPAEHRQNTSSTSGGWVRKKKKKRACKGKKRMLRRTGREEMHDDASFTFQLVGWTRAINICTCELQQKLQRFLSTSIGCVFNKCPTHTRLAAEGPHQLGPPQRWCFVSCV